MMTDKQKIANIKILLEEWANEEISSEDALNEIYGYFHKGTPTTTIEEEDDEDDY